MRAVARALAGRIGAWPAALGVVLALAACGPPVHPLSRGAVDRFRLEPGAAKVYSVRLAAGDLLRLTVEQRGLDVALRVEGRPEVDLPYGDRVDEDLWWVAESDGSLRLEVRALGGAGECTVRVLALGSASDAERRATAAFWRGIEARVLLGTDPAGALPAAEAAAAAWRAGGMRRLEALARSDLGQIHLLRGEPERALAELERAVALAADGEAALRGRLVEWRGRAHEKTLALAEAARDYRQAALLARRSGDAYGEALAVNDRATIDDTMGELAAALDGFAHAGDLFAAQGARRAELRSRLNFASCAMKLGAMSRARPLLEEVLAATEGHGGDADLRIVALRDLGWWHRLEDQPAEALRLLSAARDLAGGDPAILDRLATVHVDLGEFDRARSLYDAVEAGLGGNRLWRAYLDTNRCRLESLAGHPRRGLGLCRRALEVFEELGVSGGAAHALYLLGEIHLALGQIEAAHAASARAVGMLEAGRLDVGSPELRSVLQSVHLDPYRLLVEVEMALHGRRPAAGWDARALGVSELTRARQLRDFLAAEHPASSAAAGVTGLQAELPAIQALLEPETSLLVYHLDAEASFLWLVDRAGLASFRLPGSRVIEPLAGSWYALLADAHQRGGRSHRLERLRAARLGELLLAPVADRLAGRRLVIVADGDLQRLPFGALPVPGGDGRPLLAEHEIVVLPSVAVLALLRREIADRPVAPGLVAVLADPVFGPEDERLEPAAAGGDRTAGGAADPVAYSRLAASSAEARDLLALAPAATSLLLEGFDARLDRVLDGRLSGFRIVHFATHTQTTSSRDHPYGLVLSRVDRAGRRIEGLLGLPHLYGLSLPAELVTLSACGTALGDDLDGEGLMGLTHGFMRAGTPRVVVSLWAVEDRATRELMAGFYRALLGERLAPAAALRRAQLTLWRQGRPSHQWAAFVLQGDWRPFLLD